MNDFLENVKVDLYTCEYNFDVFSNKPERIKENNGTE